jgi:dipeptidyl aminopeptidase/acylaminoacyl peptidase
MKPVNLPVIVNPHGGPWFRDLWGFNPEVQFLANRGYAVFQMNFRGSTGYGKQFWQSSFKQWGKLMQDDITDGVKWLIEQGTADADRIAIYGASYGGYATLAGLTFTPDLYRCGIDYVGVSNLFTFMKTIPPYWKPYLDMMYEMVGNPETEKELLTSASPIFHIDKIKIPLFIVQGAKDPRVNKNESDQMVEALKKKGIYVQYMVKENEGHGFMNEENRIEFYEAMEDFLNNNMKEK